MRDQASNLNFVPAFAPKAAVTTDASQVSAIVDCLGYGSCTLAIVTGTETAAAAVFTLLEESDAANMAGAVAVADGNMIGTEALGSFTQASDNVALKLGYIGSKRYVRATIGPSGNSPADLFVSGVWVLGYPAVAPTANPPA